MTDFEAGKSICGLTFIYFFLSIQKDKRMELHVPARLILANIQNNKIDKSIECSTYGCCVSLRADRFRHFA